MQHLSGKRILDDRHAIPARCSGAVPGCQGTRYRPEILEVTFRGKNIAEVLDLTAREALLSSAIGPSASPAALDARYRPGLSEARASRFPRSPAARLSGSSSRDSCPARCPHSTPGAAAVYGLPARRACRRASSSSTSSNYRSPGLACRARPFRDLDRAQPRGDGFRRLDHRPGPGRRRRGGHLVAEGTPEEVAKSVRPPGKFLAQLLEAR